MPKVVPFPQLYSILHTFLRNDTYVTIEKTSRKFINNYGEFPQFINKADRDPWDVIVPGYKPLNHDRQYRFKELLGVYTLPNGNHKLIVDVHTPAKRDILTVHRDVKRFQKKYENHTKMKGSILYFGFNGIIKIE
jgi:inorganic pyrophosphatase